MGVGGSNAARIGPVLCLHRSNGSESQPHHRHDHRIRGCTRASEGVETA
ncbi:unnamed protein product [Ectocarpus sp. 12 AP-2014]